MESHATGIVWLKSDVFSAGEITIPIHTIVTWINKIYGAIPVRSHTKLLDAQ